MTMLFTHNRQRLISPDQLLRGSGLPKLAGALLESPLWARQRWLRLFGWPGMAAIGMLMLCLAFYFSTIRPARIGAEMARHRAAAMQAGALAAGKGSDRSPLSPAQQLAEFYRMFPKDKNMLPWLRKVFALASNHGIALDQGEYKVTQDRIGKLTRFEITLPLKSEYPQIRKFLNSVRAETPFASIEHLQFGRQRIDAPIVEARIVLALYLEHEP